MVNDVPELSMPPISTEVDGSVPEYTRTSVPAINPVNVRVFKSNGYKLSCDVAVVVVIRYNEVIAVVLVVVVFI